MDDLKVGILTPSGSVRQGNLRDVISRVTAAQLTEPFHESRIDLLSKFSRELSRVSRRDGAAQALAYWLRKSQLRKMQIDFQESAKSNVTVLPRGLTFHIPPSNVDTIFVYSLALALLTGNQSIVRLSSRFDINNSTILRALLETLGSNEEISSGTQLVTYGHDSRITDELSAACDVRIIWGGDETIKNVRTSPLAPRAHDVTFADRASLAAIDSVSYSNLPLDERGLLAERFYNDLFWFDQLGCSSPRILVWLGKSGSDLAASDFNLRLASVIARKGYQVQAAGNIAKLNYAYSSAIREKVKSIDRSGDVLQIVEVDEFPDARGSFPGAGLLFQLFCDSIFDLIPKLTKQDQTLAVFGVDDEAIDRLCRFMTAGGLDRVVGIGDALNFSHVWDGYDLLYEFTRRIKRQ